jgi:hypothetical protein
MNTTSIAYNCPNGHRWWTKDGPAPLVNIKCPNCGVTAMLLHRAESAPRWQVEALRTIEGDVRPPGASDG